MTRAEVEAAMQAARKHMPTLMWLYEWDATGSETLQASVLRAGRAIPSGASIDSLDHGKLARHLARLDGTE